jgi:hypothetical protein
MAPKTLNNCTPAIVAEHDAGRSSVFDVSPVEVRLKAWNEYFAQ